MPRETDFKQILCADRNGFSLHAAVRCAVDDRKALEQLCRYITRPALANERVQTNAAGQVVLKLKTAWRDGTTHLVMSPLEFMQRLAALVPRPRLHLIRFHGVLAPNGYFTHPRRNEDGIARLLLATDFRPDTAATNVAAGLAEHRLAADAKVP